MIDSSEATGSQVTDDANKSVTTLVLKKLSKRSKVKKIRARENYL